MAFIAIPEPAEGSEAAGLYDEERESTGYVSNSLRLFAQRPAVLRAWQQLNGAIKEGWIEASGDLRRYELATLAAAGKLRSTYCSLAHGMVLVERFYDADTVRALAVDSHSAGLDEADVALMELAKKVVEDATAISGEEIDRLRGLGLTDEEIVLAVLAAAARCFFSKTLDALGVLPDAAYADLDSELREALTVGRPIEGRPA
jgi:uncharacterized peroxidase-related enzyme